MTNEQAKKILLNSFNTAKTDGELRAFIYDLVTMHSKGIISDDDLNEILEKGTPTPEAEAILDKYDDRYYTNETDPLNKRGRR